jgi:hypothetical protein
MPLPALLLNSNTQTEQETDAPLISDISVVTLKSQTHETTTPLGSNWDGGWGWRTFLSHPFVFWNFNMTQTNSAVFDGYTFVHANAGVFQFLLNPFFWVNPWKSMLWGWFAFNFGMHFLFEVFENSPLGIHILRHFYPQYVGDTFINSIGDLLAFSVGYLSVALSWVYAPLVVTIMVAVLVFACSTLANWFSPPRWQGWQQWSES